MNFFFYGTLLDPDVRRLVLGSGADALRLESAWLRGFRRAAIRNSSAPLLVPKRGISVEGVLARGIDRRLTARLCHFEGSGYRLAPQRVRLKDGQQVPALVFLGNGRIPARRMSWQLAEWQRHHKRAFLRLTVLRMAAYREAEVSRVGKI